MILLHRLEGEALVVNADLIESIEARPETVLTLVDGRKAVVSESPSEIIERVIGFRAAVLAAADDLRRPALAPAPSATLVLLHGEDG